MLKKALVVFVLVASMAAQARKPKPAPAAPSAPAAANETIVLTGGKLLTITHGVIENGVVVMQNGRIAAVGGAGTAIPAGAKVIDVTGMTVYPGLIDSETHLRLPEVSADRMTVD